MYHGRPLDTDEHNGKDKQQSRWRCDCSYKRIERELLNHDCNWRLVKIALLLGFVGIVLNALGNYLDPTVQPCLFVYDHKKYERQIQNKRWFSDTKFGNPASATVLCTVGPSLYFVSIGVPYFCLWYVPERVVMEFVPWLWWKIWEATYRFIESWVMITRTVRRIADMIWNHFIWPVVVFVRECFNLFVIIPIRFCHDIILKVVATVLHVIEVTIQVIISTFHL